MQDYRDKRSVYNNSYQTINKNCDFLFVFFFIDKYFLCSLIYDRLSLMKINKMKPNI